MGRAGTFTGQASSISVLITCSAALVHPGFFLKIALCSWRTESSNGCYSVGISGSVSDMLVMEGIACVALSMSLPWTFGFLEQLKAQWSNIKSMTISCMSCEEIAAQNHWN